jgi:hypothetical protein
MNDAALTYSLLTAPYGMAISATTGRVTWELYGLRDIDGLPVTINPGDYPVTIRVADNFGHSDEQTFTLIVED